MKRCCTSSGRRKLDYPTSSEFKVDTYLSPKKQLNGSRQNITRHSAGSGRDWHRRMDGFSDLVQNTTDPNPQPCPKFTNRPQAQPLCNSMDGIDTQQDIEDWQSSDEDKAAGDTSILSVHLVNKKQVTKRRRKSAPQPSLRLPVRSQESVPSIDDIESPSPTGKEAFPAGTDGETNLDLPADSDDYDSPSPVISVARSQSPSLPPVSTANKSKPSDWLRDVKWQRTTPEKSDETETNLEDSAKKKRNKYLKDGLAASLERLINHEKSSSAFWKHRVAQDIDKTADDAKIVTLHIISYKKESSLVTAVSQILAPSDEHKILNVGDKLIATFTETVWTERKIKCGSVVKIYPPWQMLRRACGEQVMLCTNHCLVSEVRPLDTVEHAGGTTEVIAQWSCPCLRDEVAQIQDCPAHKNPVTMPVRPSPIDCSAKPQHPGCLSGVFAQPSQDLRVINDSHPSPEFPPHSLLEGIERVGTCPDSQITFTGLVQRVFWKHNTKYDSSLGPSANNTCRRCSLLLQDLCGFVCELVLPPGVQDRDQWKACLLGQGKVFTFSGIRVLQRLTQDKCPKLFSIIKSVWRPESVIRKPSTSQDNSQTEDSAPIHPPTFSYTLQATPGESSCNYQPASDGSAVYTPRASHTLADLEGFLKSGDLRRVQITARAVYHQADDPPLRESVYLVDDEVPNICVRVVITDCLDSDDITWMPSKYYHFRDILVHHGQCTLDEYSSVQQSDRTAVVQPTEISVLNLPPLVESSEQFGLYKIQGEVCWVDEDTAYSWMVCSFCDSDTLHGGTAQMPFVTCARCGKAVSQPRNKMNLEVYISYSPLEPVKIMLGQQTIEGLLPQDTYQEGYDVQCILGRKVGPLSGVLVSKQTVKGCHGGFYLREVPLPS